MARGGIRTVTTVVLPWNANDYLLGCVFHITMLVSAPPGKVLGKTVFHNEKRSLRLLAETEGVQMGLLNNATGHYMADWLAQALTRTDCAH